MNAKTKSYFIGLHLRRARNAKGWSQDVLASMIGMSQPSKNAKSKSFRLFPKCRESRKLRNWKRHCNGYRNTRNILKSIEPSLGKKLTLKKSNVIAVLRATIRQKSLDLFEKSTYRNLLSYYCHNLANELLIRHQRCAPLLAAISGNEFCRGVF